MKNNDHYYDRLVKFENFKYEMFCKIKNKPMCVADIIENICDLVGIPTDSASFISAASDLPINARFSIPNFD